MTENGHGEDIEDMGAEIVRLETALRVACQNIVQLNDQRQELTEALGTAMNVINQLLNDLRAAGATPSQGLALAKGKLDVAMKKLLKE